MTRALLIVNPAAGGGTARADVEALLDVLRDGFGTIDLLEDRPRAPDRSRAGGAGGPRGLRRRARCRRRWHGRPGGTRSRWQEGRARRPAVRHVHEHRAIDVGQVGETLFFEAAGIGMDADAFTAGRAIQRGDHGFAMAALGALLRRRGVRVRIDVDGRVTHRIPQAVVSNGPWHGWGFEVAPGARVDDGELDLVVFGDSKPRVLREMIAPASTATAPPAVVAIAGCGSPSLRRASRRCTPTAWSWAISRRRSRPGQRPSRCMRPVRSVNSS